jgi:lipoate-protein ligase A
MALDETLLESAAQLGGPVLRFYGWREPAASFGYFQRYADVAQMTALRPLVRRPTGGGVVPHDADWTYSLVFAPGTPWYRLRAVESYRQLHDWLREAFAQLGVATELSARSSKQIQGHCFAGPEQFDLLWQGRKIAGAAQRRTRQGLLIQGSVQPPPGCERADWEEAVLTVARSRWGVRWEALTLPAAVQARADELVQRKYGCAAYHQQRQGF